MLCSTTAMRPLAEDGARKVQPANLPPLDHRDTQQSRKYKPRTTSNGENTGDVEAPCEKLTTDRYHPHAPQPQPQDHHETSPDEHEEPTPMGLCGNEGDNAPRYVGRIHDFPARASRSRLVRNAGGRGVMLAFRALEVLEPVFTPKPTAPDPQTIPEALTAPDANDDEINNMRRLSVFTWVPLPTNENITTPRWVFRRKFENGTFIGCKA